MSEPSFWASLDRLAGVSSVSGERTVTGRQRQVIVLYAEGHTYDEIASDLGIGKSTVREYMKRAKQTWTDLGRPTRTRADVVLRVREDGLL